MPDVFEHARNGNSFELRDLLRQQIKATPNASREDVIGIVNSLYRPYLTHQAFPEGAITKHTPVMLFIMHAGSNERDQQIERKTIAGVRALINMGAKIDIPNRVTKMGNGWTCLFWAVYFRMPVLVEALLDLNAKVDVQDHLKRTALHIACGLCNNTDHQISTPQISDQQYNNMCEIIRQLVSYGIDANATDARGHKASEHLTGLAPERRAYILNLLKGQQNKLPGLNISQFYASPSLDLSARNEAVMFAEEAQNQPILNEDGTTYTFTNTSMRPYNKHPIATGFYRRLQQHYTTAADHSDRDSTVTSQAINTVADGVDTIADAVPVFGAGAKIATSLVRGVNSVATAHELQQMRYLVATTNSRRFFDYVSARVADRLAMIFADEQTHSKHLALQKIGEDFADDLASRVTQYGFSPNADPQDIIDNFCDLLVSMPKEDHLTSLVSKFFETSDEVTDKSLQPVLVESRNGEERDLYHPNTDKTSKLVRYGRVGPPTKIPIWYLQEHKRYVDDPSHVIKMGFKKIDDTDQMRRYFAYRIADRCVSEELPKLLGGIPEIDSKSLKAEKFNNLKHGLWRQIRRHKAGTILCTKDRMADVRKELAKALAIVIVFGSEHQSQHPMLNHLGAHSSKPLIYKKTHELHLTRQASNRAILNILQQETETRTVTISPPKAPSCLTKARYKNKISLRINSDTDYAIPDDLSELINSVLNRVCQLLHEMPLPEELTIKKHLAPDLAQTSFVSCASEQAADLQGSFVSMPSMAESSSSPNRGQAQMNTTKMRRKAAIQKNAELCSMREVVMAQTPAPDKSSSRGPRFFGDTQTVDHSRRDSIPPTVTQPTTMQQEQTPGIWSKMKGVLPHLNLFQRREEAPQPKQVHWPTGNMNSAQDQSTPQAATLWHTNAHQPQRYTLGEHPGNPTFIA